MLIDNAKARVNVLNITCGGVMQLTRKCTRDSFKVHRDQHFYNNDNVALMLRAYMTRVRMQRVMTRERALVIR